MSRRHRELEALERLAAEQAALRRVATLAAEGTEPVELFAAVTREVAGLFADAGAWLILSIVRFDPGSEFVLMGSSEPQVDVPIGSRWGPTDLFVSTRIRRTGRSARVDEADVASQPGPDADLLRRRGLLYQVGSPIVVEGQLWGAMTMNSNTPLPVDTVNRLESFTELIATAVANAESRHALRQLADEQAALRRVATLVARGAQPAQVFNAVAEEVARRLAVTSSSLWRFESDGTATPVAAWSAHGVVFPIGERWDTSGNYVVGAVLRTGRPARVHDFSGPIGVQALRGGVRSAVGSPIMVEGRLWGVVSAASSALEPIPLDIEERLASFTELIATAIANSENSSHLARLAEEQAALRRIAVLVAEDVPASELFEAVAREVGTLLGADFSGVARFQDATVAVVASWAADGEHPLTPRFWQMQPGEPAATIAGTRAPTRIDEWAAFSGPIAESIRQSGVRSTVGTPIVVQGRVWGALAVHSKQRALPPDTEARMAQFTVLGATAIANAQARAETKILNDEQAALRRVAELVAREAPQAEIFTAIAEEIGELIGTDQMRMMRYEGGTEAVVAAAAGARDDVFAVGSRWPLGGENATSRVFRTGQPARIEHVTDFSGPIGEAVLSNGVRSVVGAPIMVHGELWAAMLGATFRDEPLPVDTESRLSRFTELMATAIANADARGEVKRLAEEQAALRRVATLVAQGAPTTDVFGTVAVEVAGVLRADHVVVCRYEPGCVLTVLAHHGMAAQEVPPGTQINHEGGSVEAVVRRTGRSARLESYEGVQGTIAELARAAGVQVTVGAPVVVDGQLWGVAAAGWNWGQSPPADTEERMATFAGLLATTIANADANEALRKLADEQAALRRVATLVAEGASPVAVLDAVAGEVETLLDADQVTLNRFEPGEEMVALAHRGVDAPRVPVGSRVSTKGESATARVRRTGRPARIESYEAAEGAIAEGARATGLGSSVAVPIAVEGSKLWGIFIASWKGQQSPPADTEERMFRFAQLLATAIANADSREALRGLVAEQAALRRVAMLVASGASPAQVFDAVAAEMAAPLNADGITLCRYEPGGELTVLAHRGPGAQLIPPGTRVRHDGHTVSATVRRTQRPARVTNYADTHGHIGEVIESLTFRSGVGAPIFVDGRLWGVTIANWIGEEPPPTSTEDHMAEFTELLDTAIANADSRDQLTASRARLVTEADDARRRVVRDLHDGAQQRLLQAIVTLQLAQRALEPNSDKAEALIAEALAHARQGNTELRELAHGILPAILTQRGLRSGISSIVSRLELPVEVDVPGGRYPVEIEASAYFVVAEALTNVVKHSQAERAWVTARLEDGMLRVEVRDDGVGGADRSGRGLVGLGDRVSAIGGQLVVESPESGGTLVAARLPISPVQSSQR